MSRTIKGLSPDMISDWEYNANIIMPSESHEEILHPNNSSVMDGGTSSEAISASLSNFGPELPLESWGAHSESVLVDVQSYSDYEHTSDDSDTSSDESDSACWPPEVSQFTSTK